MPTAAAPITSVPVVSIATFQPQHAWSWAYYTKDGAFYSSERYEVISVEGSIVTLEMASRFKESDPYRFHHRLVVDVKKCLEAYATAGVKKNWAFKMYYWTGGTWDSVGTPPSTAAFEEKFNCNSHVVKTADMETLFGKAESALGGQNIFQQKSKKRADMAWFFLEGSNAGIAAQRFADIHDRDFGYLMLFLGTSLVDTPTEAFSF